MVLVLLSVLSHGTGTPHATPQCPLEGPCLVLTLMAWAQLWRVGILVQAGWTSLAADACASDDVITFAGGVVIAQQLEHHIGWDLVLHSTGREMCTRQEACPTLTLTAAPTAAAPAPTPTPAWLPNCTLHGPPPAGLGVAQQRRHRGALSAHSLAKQRPFLAHMLTCRPVW